MKISNNVLIYFFLCLLLVILVPLIKNIFFDGNSNENNPIPNSELEVVEPPVIKKIQPAPISDEEMNSIRSYYNILKTYANNKLRSLREKSPDIERFNIFVVSGFEPVDVQKVTEIAHFSSIKDHRKLYKLHSLTKKDDWQTMSYLAPSGKFQLDFKSDNDKISSKLYKDPAYSGWKKGKQEEKVDKKFIYHYYYLGQSWCYIRIENVKK